MPRLWMTDPTAMCRKHLLAEHHECHVFLGKLRKGHRLDGYIASNLFSLYDLHARHERLVLEMLRRGYSHSSPFPDQFEVEALGAYLPLHKPICRASAKAELDRRCDECFCPA